MKAFARGAIIFCAMAATVLATVLVRNALREPSCPRAQFVEEIDLGVREYGSWVTVPIAIRNDGQAPLQISSVRASCGCMVFLEPWIEDETFAGETIAPGTAVVFHARMIVRGEVGTTSVDEITFSTNDPDRPRGKIVLKAQVEGSVVASPGKVQFGTLARLQTASRRVELHDRRKSVGAVRSVVVEGSDRISAEWNAIKTSSMSQKSGHGAYLGAVEINVRMPEVTGEIQGKVIVAFTNDSKPLVIPVSAAVEPLARVYPTVLVLPQRRGKKWRYSGTFVCLPAAPDIQLKLESISPGLEVRERKFIDADGQSACEYTVTCDISRIGSDHGTCDVRLSAKNGSFSDSLPVAVHCRRVPN